MTFDSTVFTYNNHVSHTSFIDTSDSSQLYVSLVETITTSNMSFPTAFHIPKLIINLIYIGQRVILD